MVSQPQLKRPKFKDLAVKRRKSRRRAIKGLRPKRHPRRYAVARQRLAPACDRQSFAPAGPCSDPQAAFVRTPPASATEGHQAQASGDLFRARLDQIINMRHELAQATMAWSLAASRSPTSALAQAHGGTPGCWLRGLA